MRLTKEHKEAFVKSVMDDVPKINYQVQFEKLVEADILKVTPPEIAAIYKDLKLRPYVVSSSNSFGSFNCVYISDKPDRPIEYYLRFHGVAVVRDYVPSPEAIKMYVALDKLRATQADAHKTLRDKIIGTIGACLTLKIAHSRLPEFAKYLPKAEIQTSFLPAIANLTTDLMKAGWPKDKATA